MTYTVYALFDEREPDVVRYIGFSQDPALRHSQHLIEAKRRKLSYRLHWIQKVQRENARVLWRTLDTFATAEEAAAREVVLIAEYLANGHPLTNGTEGGEGVNGCGGRLTPELLAKRIETQQTDEYRAQAGEHSKKRWAQEGAAENQTAKMAAFFESEAGQKFRTEQSERARQMMSDPTYTGGPRTEQARGAMRLAKLGKPHARKRTAEWNAKIAESNKGIKKTWSTEAHARHDAAMARPETRAKMSAAAKRRGYNRTEGWPTRAEALCR